MTDHLDALERLARMRAEGMLTEAEFEAEKQRLLSAGTPDNSASAGVEAQDAEREEAIRKLGRAAWIVAALVVAGLLFLAWDRFGFGGHSALAGGKGILGPVAGDPPLWTLKQETDPMTDEQVASAVRTFEVNGFQIEATVACHPSSGQVVYTFNTFDADGQAAEAVTGYYNDSLGLYHTALVRVDSGTAQPIKLFDPRYTNQFEINQSPDTQPVDAIIGNSTDQLAGGRLLTIKLALKQGEPLFEIDQTDPTVAGVIKPCLDAQAKQAAARASEPQKPERGWTPTGMVSNGVPKTVTYRITDDGLSKPDTYGKIGVGDPVGAYCIGDTVVVQNDSSQTTRPVYGPFPSDNLTQLGTVAAGGSAKFTLDSDGEFVLFDQAHTGPWFHYKVSKCS